MNELECLQTFIAVADSGSFTAAAAQLGVRQPTASRRVSDLEDHLGVALLTRSTRSVAMTEPGRRYLIHARAVLTALQAAHDAATGSDRVSGPLRVAAPVSFAHSWLAPRLPGFVSAHPEITLDLALAERHVDLIADGLDVALRIGGPDAATLTGRRLRSVHRWFVASPEWCGACQVTSARVETGTGLIFAAPGTRPRRWSTPQGDLKPRRAITASNGQPLRELALGGQGLALLPDWLVADDVTAGRLRRVLRDHEPPAMSLWVVWPTQTYVPTAVRAFVDWVAHEVAETDPR